MRCLKKVVDLWSNFSLKRLMRLLPNFSFKRLTCKMPSLTLSCRVHSECITLMMMLTLVFAVVMFWIGKFVAPAYVETSNFSVQPSTCETQGLEFLGNKTCSCGEDCQSVYPCIRVYVKYTDFSTGNVTSNATLYRSPYTYWTTKPNKCSWLYCNSSAEENRKAVYKFVEQYGSVGQNFSCYPAESGDPEALLSVIRMWHFLLATLLPATFCIGICMCCTLKCQSK